MIFMKCHTEEGRIDDLCDGPDCDLCDGLLRANHIHHANHENHKNHSSDSHSSDHHSSDHHRTNYHRTFIYGWRICSYTGVVYVHIWGTYTGVYGVRIFSVVIPPKEAVHRQSFLGFSTVVCCSRRQ
jgi:hypothetical protein